MLDAQFLHLRVLGHFRKRIDMGTAQRGPLFLQKADAGVDGFLFLGGEVIPPPLEVIRKLDFPCHGWNMP